MNWLDSEVLLGIVGFVCCTLLKVIGCLRNYRLDFLDLNFFLFGSFLGCELTTSILIVAVLEFVGENKRVEAFVELS